MCNDKIIRRMAGIMVLLSVALGFMVSDNLLQASFTTFCQPEKLFARFGWFGCRAPVSDR